MTSQTKGGAAARRSTKAQADALIEEISQENEPNSEVVEHLQRQVANAFLLYSNYKRYHWQTYGPLFRDLHLLFDELAKEVLGTLDMFAERVRMIGQNPVASPEEVMETASVSVARSDLTMREMIEEADTNLLTVIKEMRAGARVADEHDDPGTNDLFSGAVQIHEKHEWWLRDILEKRDGLVS